ncbi:hypothetical protein GCM10010531_16820 [Blastococcus jejuensis]|uniref:Uncharacterized protein n=1 Tax=Blastococcus jejuensis TaxID=351224 RepID=A0ABP6P2D8_9ACTN
MPGGATLPRCWVDELALLPLVMPLAPARTLQHADVRGHGGARDGDGRRNLRHSRRRFTQAADDRADPGVLEGAHPGRAVHREAGDSRDSAIDGDQIAGPQVTSGSALIFTVS